MDIGIMQGRLLPKLKGRYQAFPVGHWEAEFFIAKELGLQNIEFILDYGTDDQNPLMTKDGIARIKSVINSSGVGVKAICADYFMEAPFHSSHRSKSEEVLKVLIENAAELGVRDIVIPCVDQSSMKTPEHQEQVVSSISKVLPLAEKKNIFLNFETDLAPRAFREFLNKLKSPNIKVNYDIGNSAALGYDPTEEFEAYGHLISDLHIKDRVLGGTTVKLGTGNANFEKVFSLLKQVNFKGNITMQASRAATYLEDFAHVKYQLEFARKYVQKFLES
jgi:L-ribulose-5-phosphate 3-epimerase